MTIRPPTHPLYKPAREGAPARTPMDLEFERSLARVQFPTDEQAASILARDTPPEDDPDC